MALDPGTAGPMGQLRSLIPPPTAVIIYSEMLMRNVYPHVITLL